MINIILTHHTDICKLVRQVAPPAVGVAPDFSSCLDLASNLKVFWLVTLLPWPLTFRKLIRHELPVSRT